MILALKLLLTPIFIAGVSLAGRRWGPAASGFLTGLPLTSGPISLVLALQHDQVFAAQAAAGSLVGQASVCLFCLGYAFAAPRRAWPASVATAMAAFSAATFLWWRVSLALLPALAALVIVILIVLWLVPAPPTAEAIVAPPSWDLPARIILATTFVFVVTSASSRLGPALSGMLAPFPVFGLVLSAFTHHQQGSGAAIRLLRGVVAGSLAFGAFFLIVGLGLPLLGMGWTYPLASMGAVVVSGATWWASRRAERSAR